MKPSGHPTSPYSVRLLYLLNYHHGALWLRATVEMRLRRVYAPEGVWHMCGRGRAGVRQERTAQYGIGITHACPGLLRALDGHT